MMLAPIVVATVAALVAGDGASYKLPNGLLVRLAPDDLSVKEEKVIVLLGVRAGILDEPADKPHLAHLVEHVTVFAEAPGSQEAAAVGRWYAAGQANAETLHDFMYFDLHVAREELDLALRVQAARLASPLFDSGTLEREVPRALSELEFVEKAERGGTSKFAWSAFAQAALHGRARVPLREATRSLTVEDVRVFHARLFRPDRAVLSVVGGFDPSAARKAIDAVFGPIAKPEGPPPSLARLRDPGVVEARWDAATSHLLMAWPAPAPDEADPAALALATLVLQRRLFGEPELASLARWPLVAVHPDGLVVVNVQVKDPARLGAVRQIVAAQVERLAAKDGIGGAEIDFARAELRQLLEPGEIAVPPQVPRLLALGNIELQRMMRALAWGDLAAYAERLGRADARGVSAAAKRLDPKRAVAVELRPAA